MRNYLIAIIVINIYASAVYAQFNEGIPPPLVSEPSIFVPNISDYDSVRDNRLIIPTDPLMPQSEKEPCLHDMFDYPPPNACEYR